MRLIKFFIFLSCTYVSSIFGNEADLLRNSYYLLSQMHMRIGLKNNVSIVIDKDVKIALSKFEKEQSFIHINPDFYNDSTTLGKNIILAGLIAHELGHILAGHNHNNHTHIEEELAADYFTGFMLKGLGYTLLESKNTLQYFESLIDTTTHGNIAQRFQEIEKGYANGHFTSAINRDLFYEGTPFDYKITIEKDTDIYFIDGSTVFTIDKQNNRIDLAIINKKSSKITLDKQSFLVDLHSLKLWLITNYEGYIEVGTITPRA